jgi:hypothetical protein
MPRITDSAPDFPSRVIFRAAFLQKSAAYTHVHVTDPRVAYTKEWRFLNRML